MQMSVSVAKKMGKNKYLVISLFLLAFSQTVAFLFTNNETIINSRMFFGLLGSNSLSILVLFVFITALFLYFLKSTKKYKYPLIFVLSGTVSNLSDRIFFGGARDYFKVQHWPTFNLADTLIVVGIFFFCYYFFSEKN